MSLENLLGLALESAQDEIDRLTRERDEARAELAKTEAARQAHLRGWVKDREELLTVAKEQMSDIDGIMSAALNQGLQYGLNHDQIEAIVEAALSEVIRERDEALAYGDSTDALLTDARERNDRYQDRICELEAERDGAVRERDEAQAQTARWAKVAREMQRERDEARAALARVEALADEYAKDEREHLNQFGHHHPVAWNVEKHLREALGQ